MATASTTTEPALAATGEAPGLAQPDQQAEPRTRLQDVLPEIQALAQRVGGLSRLAEIVEQLRRGQA